jgi:hypothetical protein
MRDTALLQEEDECKELHLSVSENAAISTLKIKIVTFQEVIIATQLLKCPSPYINDTYLLFVLKSFTILSSIEEHRYTGGIAEVMTSFREEDRSPYPTSSSISFHSGLLLPLFFVCA